MGSSQSRTFPPGTFSSNEPGVEATPYTIRRHPRFQQGVLELPEDMPNAQAFYLRSVKQYGDREYIGSRKVVDGKRDKDFTFITYFQAFEKSKAFGSGLVELGVKNEDFVCIYSENRPEWVLTMDASYLYGYVTVALYDTFTTDSLSFSIKNCGANYIVCSQKNLKRLFDVDDETLGQFKYIITFDPVSEDQAQQVERAKGLGVEIKTFDEIVEMGMGLDKPYNQIHPEQLLYVCYSSGTTGFPKGVMISHRSFITNLLGIHQEGTGHTFERHLSYLPLCHVFERMCTSCTVYSGGKVGTFSGDVRMLTEDMASLKPTVMIVVPRVLHRINDAINAQLRKASPVLRFVFNTAWYLKRWLINNEYGFGLVDMVVFNKIKALLGGHIEQIVNGGAALPVDLHERMQVILGCSIRPGYGLSEGGSGNTLSPLKLTHIKFGTSGYPLANVQLRIVKVPEFEDPGVGEIQMGGSGLCSGYLNDQAATDELFTDETHTWIHTGDIGKFDDDNALCVVDRMRSIFKLSQGEYVAGDLLATYFEAAPLIQNMFVFGDSTRAHLVGIVLPDIVHVAQWLGKERISHEEYAEALKTKELHSAIQKQIDAIAVEKKLLGYQKVNKIALIDDEWTIENGILSPTFKPKRKVLAARYEAQINALYSEK